MQTVSQDNERAIGAQKRTFLFLSSCWDLWGGSEELWSTAALRLAHAGHHVHVFKTSVDFDHRRIKELTSAGIPVQDHWSLPVSLPAPVARRLARLGASFLCRASRCRRLSRAIRRLQPDLVVVSQGENFDGAEYCDVCLQAGVPYAIISQKASDQHWPDDDQRAAMKQAYAGAKRSFFVARHNRELTEMQMGARLPNAEVVRNPFLTPVDEPLPWPETADGRLRLACVARLFVQEKGQDVLLRVLALEKWKARPLDVTFYGQGLHSEALKQMAALLEIKNVRFAGFTWDVTEIWRTYHGLVLSSRAEGLPLSLVEAMFCGRPAIVTAVGGNEEAVIDNETGFLASGASVGELDAAMERAWERRSEWEAIGHLAAGRIRELIPADPGEIFTSKLLQLL